MLDDGVAERAVLGNDLELFVLVGVLGARPFIEPLVVLSGGLEPVARLYRLSFEEYLDRCVAAGLGDRRKRTPLHHLLELLGDPGAKA